MVRSHELVTDWSLMALKNVTKSTVTLLPWLRISMWLAPSLLPAIFRPTRHLQANVGYTTTTYEHAIDAFELHIPGPCPIQAVVCV